MQYHINGALYTRLISFQANGPSWTTSHERNQYVCDVSFHRNKLFTFLWEQKGNIHILPRGIRLVCWHKWMRNNPALNRKKKQIWCHTLVLGLFPENIARLTFAWTRADSRGVSLHKCTRLYFRLPFNSNRTQEFSNFNHSRCKYRGDWENFIPLF